MKTFLLSGLGSEASLSVACALAANGHRILATGKPIGMLEQLDATLVQSELHRYCCPDDLGALPTWVAEQHVGLDAVVLFPPAPELSSSILVPLTGNVRRMQAAVLEPIELLRGLLPLLRKGKTPKRVLVVLDWLSAVDSTCAHRQWLQQTWRTLLPLLSAELRQEQIRLNLLSLGAVLNDVTHAALLEETGSEQALSARLRELSERAPGGVLLRPHEIGALVSTWTACPLAALTGQIIDHP